MPMRYPEQKRQCHYLTFSTDINLRRRLNAHKFDGILQQVLPDFEQA